MAGYTSTPLVKKLGIKEAMRLLILQPPNGIEAYWKLLEADFTQQLCKQMNDPILFIFLLDHKKNCCNSLRKLKST